MLRTTVLALALAAALAGSSRGGNAIDLVTDKSAFTIATGDIDALKTNVDRFFAQMQDGGGFRPSMFLEQFAENLGIHKGRKKDGAAAILIQPRVENQRFAGDGNWVIAVEIGDLDVLGANCGFKQGEFQREKIYEIKKGDWGSVRYARGDYLYIASNKEVLEDALAGKSIKPKLDPALVKRMGGAGLLLHVNTERLPAGERDDAIARLQRDWLPDFKTEREQEVAKALAKAVPELEHTLAWFRYDDDVLQLSLAPVFQKEGKRSQALLELFRQADTQANFIGLPEGKVVAAHSSVRNNGKGSAALGVLVHSFSRMFWPRGSLTGDWTHFVNIFTEVTRKLDGARFALYQSAPEQGLLSMVGILDTRNADQFLTDLQQLARIGHFQGIDLNDKETRAANLKLIKQLVADLGSEEFQVRESATIKLQLIGEPAVGDLKAAMKDADLERVRRAERIIEWIAEDAKERRQALLRPGDLANLKPSFVFLDKKEKLAGWDVHQVGIVFPGKQDPQRDRQLAGMFGPDWQRVRLATQGKQVVVLVGSDLKLLEEALNNLKAGKAGLADTVAFKKGGVDQPHTRFQISLTKIVELAKAEDLKQSKPVEKMTALELHVGQHHAELSLRMPISDVKSLQQLEGLMRGAQR